MRLHHCIKGLYESCEWKEIFDQDGETKTGVIFNEQFFYDRIRLLRLFKQKKSITSAVKNPN